MIRSLEAIHQSVTALFHQLDDLKVALSRVAMEAQGPIIQEITNARAQLDKDRSEVRCAILENKTSFRYGDKLINWRL